ncbi:hypothetical protein K4F52_006872 [Lecanicillium sp. MT-2017a]|nr:hypothetical protein K4F52_006872 [Lecanicillium sp. MT-2017a]
MSQAQLPLNIPATITATGDVVDAAALNPHPSSLHRRQESWETWCGAVRYVPDGGQIKSVEGSWTVPSISAPSDGASDEDYWVYHWVGIDGSYGCNTILQAGTSLDIYNGNVRRKFWWEFYPNDMVSSYEVAINEGDEVYVKVTAVNETAGVIYLKNKSTGQDHTIIAHLEGDKGGLCLKSAAWVAEAPHTSTYIWPLAEFSSGQISGAKATQFDDSEFGLDGAAIGNMVRDGTTLCEAKQISDSAVMLGTDI